MSDKKIDEIQGRADAAAKGKWEMRDSGWEHVSGERAVYITPQGRNGVLLEGDAQAIIHANEDRNALLKEVVRLTALLEGVIH